MKGGWNKRGGRKVMIRRVGKEEGKDGS